MHRVAADEVFLSGSGYAAAALQAALSQWLVAGGHVLLRGCRDQALIAASATAFALAQAAGALDAEAEALQLTLRSLNDGAERGPERQRERHVPPGADDASDGSSVQASLIAANVHGGKPERPLVPPPPSANLPPGCVRAPDGSLRLLSPALLSAGECNLLVAGGVAMMAGAFSRRGQTTLGISPALSHRLAGQQPLARAVPPPPRRQPSCGGAVSSHRLAVNRCRCCTSPSSGRAAACAPPSARRPSAPASPTPRSPG